ncbi:MAG: hypothetical protein RMJ97_03720 [Raineya sp.]|nr:hypothetical protein [Raineya sp.]MDW8295970.1 hypothetical protein [Raineya sp.]
MEDINKSDSFKKPDVFPTEEVNSYKEVVINPDRQELEVKFQGMKDLFTSIISENRKDYEKQLAEVKALFSTVIEENRRQMQLQMQDIYKALPRLLAEAEKLRRQEEYITINDEDIVTGATKASKMTKLGAIKEFIIGKDAKELRNKVEKLYDEIEEATSNDQNHLNAVVEEIYARLNKMEKRITDEIEKAQNEFRAEMNEVAFLQANKVETYRILRHTSEQLRLGKLEIK